MDGFYVAKFKVEKRGKISKASDSTAEVGLTGIEEGEQIASEKEKIAFDDDEDRPYIEGMPSPHSWFCFTDCFHLNHVLPESKRRRMKAKGLKPPPRTTVKIAAWSGFRDWGRYTHIDIFNKEEETVQFFQRFIELKSPSLLQHVPWASVGCDPPCTRGTYFSGHLHLVSMYLNLMSLNAWSTNSPRTQVWTALTFDL